MQTVPKTTLFETSFTNKLVLTYGPLDRLGRFFLLAEQKLATLGLVLSFGTFEELLVTNRANAATWKPLLPSFDPTVSELSADKAFCIMARNSEGDVVATQGARLFTWTDSNFFEEAASMRLFYADPKAMRWPGEACHATAEATRGIDGRVMFSGGAWFRPDYRGKGLGLVMPRIARFYAFSHWYTDFTISLQTEAVATSAFSRQVGHRHIDWAFMLENTPVMRSGTVRTAAMWTDATELLHDLDVILGELSGPQVDGAVEDVSRYQGDAVGPRAGKR